MESLIIGDGLNTAFLFMICVGLLMTAYRMALETARDKYQKMSRSILILNVAFYWIGGSALVALMIVGLVNNGIPNKDLWVFFFIILVLPSLYGIARGLKSFE